MKPRRKYAYPDEPRRPARVTGMFRHKAASKYTPHQGEREKARRVRQGRARAHGGL